MTSVPMPCEHDTLGCRDRTPHEEHTKVGDGRPCCGWPPRCAEPDDQLAIAKSLAEHRSSRPAFIREADGNDWHHGVSICTCGETFTGAHDTHLATVLAALLDAARREGGDERAEQIAQAIEESPSHRGLIIRSLAARIAREPR